MFQILQYEEHLVFFHDPFLVGTHDTNNLQLLFEKDYKTAKTKH